MPNAHLVARHGQVLMVELVRYAGNGPNKVTTPILEPQDNDPNWAGKSLVMALGHSGMGGGAGHYMSFFKVNNIWWKVDTAGAGTIVRENPFITQMGARDVMGFSVNFLVFA